MTRYRLSPKARSDLEAIWDYTADRWSIDQADCYIRDIVELLDRVCEGREKGRRIDQIRRDYLQLPIGSHLLIFRQPRDTVDVVRILHRRMDVTARLRD